MKLVWKDTNRRQHLHSISSKHAVMKYSFYKQFLFELCFTGPQRMRWLDCITNAMDMNLSKLSWTQQRTGKPGMLQSMGSQRVRQDLEAEQQQQSLYYYFCG